VLETRRRRRAAGWCRHLQLCCGQQADGVERLPDGADVGESGSHIDQHDISQMVQLGRDGARASHDLCPAGTYGDLVLGRADAGDST